MAQDAGLLVWIDMEMTGLQPETDRIIEVALVVTDVLRAFEEGRVVQLRNPLATRPWQHVLEPLAGYLLLAQRLHEQGQPFAQAWNFGPSEAGAQSVQWIVEQMARRWGAGAHWQAAQGVHPHEAMSLKLDTSKARNLLGWRPVWGLGHALDLIVDWAAARRQGADVRALTLQQIASHEHDSEHIGDE